MLLKVVAAALLLNASYLALANGEVASSITEVMVYPGGASVTRTAAVTLDKGANDLTFIGLVSDLEPDRFQLSVDVPSIEIGQVRLSEIQSEEAFDVEVQRLENSIFDVNNDLRAVDDDIKVAQLQLKFLDGIAAGYAKETWSQVAQGSADIESWRSALAVLDQGASQAHKRVRDTAVTRRELSAKMSKLQRELRNLRGGSLSAKVVHAIFTAPAATNATVRLTYFLYNAEWRPVYQARLDSDSGRLRLTQEAEVRQSTDEDWIDVALTLSTSQPTGELSRPELDPLFATFLKEVVVTRSRIRRDGVQTLSDAPEEIEEIIVSGSSIRIRPKIGNYGVSYPISAPTTVANDVDDSTTVDLAQFEFDVDLITQVVPSESESAFLAARFEYDEATPLYGGAMKVYLDGVYAGTTQMRTALPGVELTLPMGQDRRVDVRADDQGGENAVGGFIGKRRQEATDYLFTITNRHEESATVEVYDQYPVAREDTIDVKVPRTATAPSEKDIEDQPGLIVWRRSLDPGEVWQIRHQYEVSYPADKTLTWE